jgi:WD40 repeat protein
MNHASGEHPLEASQHWPKFPYPGLRPFKESEASIFYGRTKQKDEVVERLSKSQMVFITGSSGCGKSSLVKAGVIPALGAGVLTRPGYKWRIVQTRPGRRPIHNLSVDLRAAFGFNSSSIDIQAELGRALEEDQSGLWCGVDLLEDQTPGPMHIRPVLLLVDQFEEIFGPQITNLSEVDKFVRLLVTQFANPHPRIYVIITCRTDYIGLCAKFLGLAELINDTVYLTTVLDSTSLRDAITKPIEDYGGRVDPELVTEILADMGSGTKYSSDNLPLMQHALLWLWQKAVKQSGIPLPQAGGCNDQLCISLDAQDYRAGGGMRGILNTHAGQILATAISQAGPESGRVVEAIFRRISERDSRGRYHRTPASTREIKSLTNCSTEQLEAIIEPFAADSVSFIEARVTTNLDDTLLDVSHESLIRQWQVARTWADKEAEKIRTFRDLLRTAELWQSQNLRPDLLKRAGELKYLEEWWNCEKPTAHWAQRYFNPRSGEIDGATAFGLVSRYLNESHEADREEKDAAERARQKQEAQRLEAERQRADAALQKTHRQRDRAIAGVALVAGLLMAAVAYGYWATSNEFASYVANEKLQAKAIALRADAALEYESPAKAALIALEAVKRNLPETPEIKSALYRSLGDLREKRRFSNYPLGLNGVAYSPKGDILATREGGKVMFLNSATGEVLDEYNLSDSYVGLWGLQWSPDGEQIAISSRSFTILLKPCSRPKLKSLFSCSSDKDERVDLNIPEGRAGSIKFSRDGSWAITSGWFTPVRKWDLESGRERVERTFAESSFPNAAAITQDMKYVGVGRPNGQILLFDADKEQQQPFKQIDLPKTSRPIGSVLSLAFSPVEASTFAASTQDGSIWLGNISGDPAPRALPGMHGISYQLAFSDDGKHLVAGSDDTRVRVWNLEQTISQPVELRGHTGPVYFVQFSPDGFTILSGAGDKTVRQWSRLGPLHPEKSSEHVTRPALTEHVRPALDQLQEAASYLYFAGDVHINGEIVAASAAGVSLLDPQLPLQPMIEWGRGLTWKDVWFASNPDRIVATTADGVSYNFLHFVDVRALSNFVSLRLPFDGPDRIRLTDQEICKLHFGSKVTKERVKVNDIYLLDLIISPPSQPSSPPIDVCKRGG